MLETWLEECSANCESAHTALKPLQDKKEKKKGSHVMSQGLLAAQAEVRLDAVSLDMMRLPAAFIMIVIDHVPLSCLLLSLNNNRCSSFYTCVLEFRSGIVCSHLVSVLELYATLYSQWECLGQMVQEVGVEVEASLTHKLEVRYLIIHMCTSR